MIVLLISPGVLSSFTQSKAIMRICAGLVWANRLSEHESLS